MLTVYGFSFYQCCRYFDRSLYTIDFFPIIPLTNLSTPVPILYVSYPLWVPCRCRLKKGSVLEFPVSSPVTMVSDRHFLLGVCSYHRWSSPHVGDLFGTGPDHLPSLRERLGD